jgi:hypothetical protein
MPPSHSEDTCLSLLRAPALFSSKVTASLIVASVFLGLLSVQNNATAAYAIQMGAFKDPDNASSYSSRIADTGFPTITVAPAPDKDRLTYVIVGPFADKTTANTIHKQLATNAWHGYVRSWSTDERLPDSNSGEGNSLLIAEAPSTNQATDSEILIIDDTAADTGEDMLIIEEGETDLIIEDETHDGLDTEITSAASGGWTDQLHYNKGNFSIGLDKARLEYGNLYQSKSSVNTSNYGHLALSGEWNPDPAWELQFAGRLDWYDQTGSPSVDEIDLDYGDSFVRYRGENYRVTAGTQTIIWGRIDELPPTDRLSRADISRGILDPLEERRRAMPVMRFEGFKEGYKLDAVWIPDFRKAALADKDSIWYPVNQSNGTILGFESNPVMKTFVQQGSISDGAPDGDGGFGLRLSETGQQFDYAATVQYVRQSTPYWQLDPSVRNAFMNGADPATAIASGNGGTFRARYPRTWVAGGDFGFEALSATWRFEAAWISDTPVTRKDLRYDTVNSANWAAGAQFYPGDSDIRVNLQITGINLIDAPAVLDRTHIYNFNGSIFNEFGNNRWQATTRFFIGLDKKDIYINPEISFIGWEPHELYAGVHYFNGDEETTGGYWENNSLLTLGWRSQF